MNHFLQKGGVIFRRILATVVDATGTVADFAARGHPHHSRDRIPVWGGQSLLLQWTSAGLYPWQRGSGDVSVFSSQLVINGNATQAQIARAFGVPLVTVKRYVKLYRHGGAAALFCTD
jgi:hypothetical protein